MLNYDSKGQAEDTPVVVFEEEEQEEDDDDFVEVTEDSTEHDHFVLVDDEASEEEAEVEDDDFVLTHAVKEEKEDLVAVARTKQLIFFLSLLVASYVMAINTVAAICMLAKSIHALEFKPKTPGSTTESVLIFAEPQQENTEHEDDDSSEHAIPYGDTLSTQPGRHQMMTLPSRHVESVLHQDMDEQYLPSPAVVQEARINTGISPPDIDASTYRSADHSIEEPFPSLWPQPTPSPRRTYPSLAVMTIVDSSKATDVSHVEQERIVPSTPKARPLNFPSIGGKIPFSPTLHIPSVAVDRVRNLWNWGRNDNSDDGTHESAKNTTASTLTPVPDSFDGKVSNAKDELDRFIRSSGDHALVLFYTSQDESSHKLLSAWHVLSEKVRYTMKIDCSVEQAVCPQHGGRLPFAFMVKEGRLRQPLELDYDAFHMFTNFVKAIDGTTGNYSPPSSRAVVTTLSHYSFREFLTQNNHVVVLFGRFDGVDNNEEEYQDMLWSDLQQFAQGLEEEGLNAVVAAVDCHSNPTVCREQRIETYPTLRWFTNGVSTVPDFSKRLVKRKFIKYARRVLAGIE